MKYDVEIPELATLQRAFAKAPGVVAREVITAGNRALVRYQGTAKLKAPVDTSQLRGAIQVTPMHQQGSNILGSVSARAKHALWQEEGTGIYGPRHTPIRPRRAKMLSFVVGGKRVFAKSVRGTRGKWYMKGSVEQNEGATKRDFQAAVDRVVDHLGGRV